MPFTPIFESFPAFKRVILARRRPIMAYAIAIGLVIAATLLRWLIGDALAGVPFITYYPAIVVATVVGGFWPGSLAMALSTITAWYLFLPLVEPDQREVSMLIFIFLSGVNVIVVALLHTAVQHVTAQEDNLRILVESSPAGIIVVDEDGKINLVNASTERLFGYTRAELLGRKIEELVPSEQAARHRVLRKAFFKKPETRPMGAGLDLSARRKDGTNFPIEVALNPLRRKGKPGVLATVIDITDRIKLRDSQQMVIRELRHRTQNLFAVFQTLANRSLDEGMTPAETKSVLNGRVQALSDAYRTLAESGWDGAPLSAVINRQLAGFSNRATIVGCEIMVEPSAAQQFALLVHELATNALKYGALSTADGHVSIDGSVEGVGGTGVLTFRWKETGGPPVSMPARKGFGSIILLDSVRPLARMVTMDFDPAGLVYELQIDLNTIVAQPAPPIK